MVDTNKTQIFSLEKITITSFQEQFKDELLAISDQQFGKSFLDENAINYYTSNKYCKVIIATDENHLAGFSILEFCTFEEAMSSLNIKLTWFHESINLNDIVCIRRHMAVHPGILNSGVGTKLLEEGQKMAHGKAKAVLSIAWENTNTTPMKKLLEKFSFQKISELNNYWFNESLERNYSCGLCGSPPCTCSAIVYAFYL